MSCGKCGRLGHYATTCGRGPKAPNASRQALRDARRAAGLCRDCGAPCAPNSALHCPEHLEAKLARQRAWRAA